MIAALNARIRFVLIDNLVFYLQRRIKFKSNKPQRIDVRTVNAKSMNCETKIHISSKTVFLSVFFTYIFSMLDFNYDPFIHENSSERSPKSLRFH